MIQSIADRKRMLHWLDTQIARWNKIREDHTTPRMHETAGHYIDCLLTTRKAISPENTRNDSRQS